MSYQLFVLAEQWPITYCKPPAICKTPIPQSFTIYGLWPWNWRPPYPSYCSGKQTVDPLQLELDYAWPNFNLGNDNFDLWQTQWNKHETCSKIFSQVEYFNQTIKMHRRINLEEIIMSGGIVPNQTVFYNTDDIINNIWNAVAKPQLMCSGSPPELQ